jgi:hypothetical protein
MFGHRKVNKGYRRQGIFFSPSLSFFANIFRVIIIDHDYSVNHNVCLRVNGDVMDAFHSQGWQDEV